MPQALRQCLQIVHVVIARPMFCGIEFQTLEYANLNAYDQRPLKQEDHVISTEWSHIHFQERRSPFSTVAFAVTHLVTYILTIQLIQQIHYYKKYVLNMQLSRPSRQQWTQHQQCVVGKEWKTVLFYSLHSHIQRRVFSDHRLHSYWQPEPKVMYSLKNQFYTNKWPETNTQKNK